MKLTRRDLLRFGLGASALAFAPIKLFAEGVVPKSIPIAVQLYSIRNIAGKDLPKTFETVASMGYTGVELAGTYGKSAQDLKKLLDDAGLKCVSTHIGMNSFEGDSLAKTVEYYKILGTKYLTIPGMNVEKTVDAWKKRAEWFNQKSELCQKDGMFIGYHNHQWEFKDHLFDGITGWEILFKNTDNPVTHQIDVGHCAGAGFDPVKYIQKFPGRTRHLHMKENGGNGIIGKGSVDWPAVIKACAEVGGTEWFIVENEHNFDKFDGIRDCYVNLAKFRDEA
ncbi:MAG: sugar phosphate isomerase/epimerase [Planctomycetia bacterium]|nr:sugar phosphate isomerase/epimerase [Planctomycetia bacterium]